MVQVKSELTLVLSELEVEGELKMVLFLWNQMTISLWALLLVLLALLEPRGFGVGRRSRTVCGVAPTENAADAPDATP